jgi:hypothetical protein
MVARPMLSTAELNWVEIRIFRCRGIQSLAAGSWLHEKRGVNLMRVSAEQEVGVWRA